MLNFCKLLTGLMFVALAAAPASAQSLAEVARKEEARRKTARTGKVYTNDTLGSAGTVETPSAPAAGAPAVADPSQSQAQAPAVTPAAPDAGDRKDEAYWRDRMKAARESLDRAKMFQEALQTRVNSLGNDFVARDDPAQRQVIANERQKALAEMDRVKQEVAQHTKAIAQIEEDARKAGAPAGWLR